MPWTYLNRLRVTGSISSTTPLCVLMEVATAHKVPHLPEPIESNREAIVAAILSHRKISAISQSPPPLRELPTLADYINPHGRWDLQDPSEDSMLMIAYNFIKTFESDIDVGEYPLDSLGFGLPNVDFPRSFTAGTLFGILRRKRVPIRSDATFDNLKTLFISLSLHENSIRTLLYKKIDALSREMMLGLITTLDVKPLVGVEWESLRAAFDARNFYLGTPNPPPLRTPTTNEDAVVFVFEKYGIDVCLATSPLSEASAQSGGEYTPYDANMRKLHLLYGSSLKLRFNPIIPLEWYRRHDLLVKIAKFEGYTEYEIGYNNDTASELIMQSYTLDESGRMTLLPGVVEPVVSYTTMGGFNAMTLRDEDCFSFGPYQGPYHVLSVTELTALFTSEKNFVDPTSASRRLIERRVIRKMLNLLKVRMTRERSQLLNIINQIMTEQDASSSNSTDLAQFIKQNKATAHQVFLALFEAGMYMRGWTGDTSRYPRRGFPIRSFEEVERRVFETIYRFEGLVEALPSSIRSKIYGLPLVQYDSYSGQVFLSQSDETGRTIQQKLNIVKEGESGTASSCIRVSSGWIITTALYWMEKNDLPTPISYKTILKTTEETDND